MRWITRRADPRRRALPPRPKPTNVRTRESTAKVQEVDTFARDELFNPRVPVDSANDHTEVLDLLRRSPLFATIPPSAQDELAARFERSEVAPGGIVVREGQEPDAYYLIAEGIAEVWELRHGGQDSDSEIDASRYTLLSRLGPGDAFGEIALLLGGRRTATVRAASPLVLYGLDRETLLGVVSRHRELAVALEEEMTLHAVASSLGRSSPFASLPTESLHWLALRFHQVSVHAGDTIVREGEPGNAVYVVSEGQVEVTRRRADGLEVRIGTLGHGGLFGEQALLSQEPRSATVRATVPTELLRLDREDFDAAILNDHELAEYLSELALRRQRPRRIDHWEMERQTGRGQADVYVLKDTVNNRYLKLSAQGAYLWDLMDGEHTVRDLAVAYFSRYGGLNVEIVLRAMLDLHAAGFVHIQPIGHGRGGPPTSTNVVGRFLEAVAPWVSREYSLPNVDRVVTRLYQHFLRPLYSRLGQFLLLVVAIVGAAGFLRDLAIGTSQLTGGLNASLAVTIVAYLVLVPSHELAHAATCKHFGRAVRGLGLGWYFFLPVAFADTSDIWMADRRARIAVVWAGPYANFVAGGLASIVAIYSGDAAMRLALSQFAALSYLLGVLNLNPLLEYDGYYILTDWLNIPNLRTKALSYLGAVLWRAGSTTVDRRLARLYLIYAGLALCYTLLLAAVVLGLYQRYIEAFLSRSVPPLAAGLVGWTVAGLIASLILHTMWRGVRAGAQQAS